MSKELTEINEKQASLELENRMLKQQLAEAKMKCKLLQARCDWLMAEYTDVTEIHLKMSNDFLAYMEASKTRINQNISEI